MADATTTDATDATTGEMGGSGAGPNSGPAPERGRRALTLYMRDLPGYYPNPDSVETIDDAARDLFADLCHAVDQTGQNEPGALLIDAYCRYYSHELRDRLVASLNADSGQAARAGQLVHQLPGLITDARAADTTDGAVARLTAAAEELHHLIMRMLRD